jgi:hypothetical protein
MARVDTEDWVRQADQFRVLASLMSAGGLRKSLTTPADDGDGLGQSHDTDRKLYMHQLTASEVMEGSSNG